jgi:hypothetical protein
MIQELVLRKWEDEWHERLKAHIQRIAEEMGCTWWDIVMENRDLFLDEVDRHFGLRLGIMNLPTQIEADPTAYTPPWVPSQQTKGTIPESHPN